MSAPTTAAVLAVLLCASVARAQTAPSSPARLALVDLPDNVHEAVEITLGPWEVEILAISTDALGPTMPETATAARVVARRHRVAAVVWLSSSDSGPALWVLDGATDKVVARPLDSEPPFDEATATAIALTIKTLLRHSLVAPEIERFGASETTREPPPPIEPPLRVGLEALSGVRVRPGTDSVEPRLGLAIFWAPALLQKRLDIGLGVRIGLGSSIATPELAATFRDNTLSAGARFRALLEPVVLAPYAAASLHLTRLDGALAANATTVAVDRINPSIDLGVRAGVHLGPVSVAVWAEGSALLRRQRYEVGGEPVLELPRVELEGGVAFMLPTAQ